MCADTVPKCPWKTPFSKHKTGQRISFWGFMKNQENMPRVGYQWEIQNWSRIWNRTWTENTGVPFNILLVGNPAVVILVDIISEQIWKYALRHTVCLPWNYNLFLYFHFLCLNCLVIERYGWELSTFQRWASNSQYWWSCGTLNF